MLFGVTGPLADPHSYDVGLDAGTMQTPALLARWMARRQAAAHTAGRMTPSQLIAEVVAPHMQHSRQVRHIDDSIGGMTAAIMA